MFLARSLLTSFHFILGAVVLNGSAVAGLDRPVTPLARIEPTQLAQKAQEQKSTKLEKIVAAIPVRALPNVPLLAGIKKGFYRQEGLEIEVVQMRSTPAITGMMTGDVLVDFHTSAIRAPLVGRPIRMIGYMVDRLNWHLYAKPEIKRVEDLKGKVLAVTELGGNTAYISQIVLEKHGLAKGFHVIARASDYVPLGLGGISTSVNTLKNRTDTIKRFLRGTIRSLQYIRSDRNKSEATELFAQILNLSRSDAELIYAQSKDYYSPNGSISKEGLQFEISLLVQELGLKKEMSIDDVADFHLLKEVQAELGLK